MTGGKEEANELIEKTFNAGYFFHYKFVGQQFVCSFVL